MAYDLVPSFHPHRLIPRLRGVVCRGEGLQEWCHFQRWSGSLESRVAERGSSTPFLIISIAN